MMGTLVLAALGMGMGEARQLGAACWRLLFKTAHRRAPKGATIGLALLHLVTSCAAYAWTMTGDGLATLWLGNGIIAGGLLLLPADYALALCTVGWLVNLTCAVSLGGQPFDRAALVASLDLAESVAVAVLARRVCGAALNVTRVCRLTALVCLAILPAALGTGLVYAFFLKVLFDAGSLRDFLIWFGGDLLSLTIALPAILLIARRRLDAPTAPDVQRTVILGGVLALSLAVFIQPVAGPFLFVVPTAMLLATFSLTPSVTAMAIAAIAFVAAGLTVAGFGPIAAFEPNDMAARSLLLQLFLAAVALSALLSSALVSERDLASRRLARTLAAARTGRRDAQQAAHAKGRFLHIMSHELRTPLNSVLGYAQIIAARPDLSETTRRQAGEIAKSGWTMVRLVDDLLEFARLDASRTELEVAPFAIADVIERAVAGASQQLDGRPVALRVASNAPSSTQHMGDAHRLWQVVDHLLGNAVKFTDRGHIALTINVTRRDDDADLCRITVRDTGPGIAPVQWEEVFQPFEQADTSLSRKYDGAGLGLALCRSLVALMGGRISMESRPGAGTAFTVELPLRRVRTLEMAQTCDA